MRQPEHELAALEQASLRRHIRQPSEGLINFSSNDYLGLATHPDLVAAFQAAAEKYGVGSTASRLICGTSSPHTELERLLAEAKGTEAALSFANGYATSIGVLTALLRKGDTVILDKLCHASLIDGARMSEATIRVFPHNHLEKLNRLLESTTQGADPDSRILVVTESIFSMDGDAAKLQEICQLTEQYNALLMVDEAHAFGVKGATGMGLAEELGLSDQIHFHMGTLGKAAGVAGGYLAASQNWIDLITNKARSFIYSTAPPPAQAAAAVKAIQLIRGSEGKKLRTKLWENIRLFQECSRLPSLPESPIIPWVVGENDAALNLSEKLQNSGFLVPAIRFPTVPRNTARLRITLNAGQSEKGIRELASILSNEAPPTPLNLSS